MIYLLDVSILLAAIWNTHLRHVPARGWIESQPAYVISPLCELGFIRVSMTAAYRASFADAQTALASIISRPQSRFVTADLSAARLPAAVAAHGEVIDAYLVETARAHRLKLATLDDLLCKKPWAAGIAENPI